MWFLPGKPVWRRCRKTAYDVVLLDVWLPGLDGLEVLERIHELEMPLL